MSFDWSQYFALAELLAEESDEAQLRTAISRAYYSAFHGARDWLRTSGKVASSSSRESHKDVWDEFHRQQPRSRCVRIASAGQRLRRSRNSADYERHMPNLKAEVQKALHQAQTILRLLGEI